jgi:peptidoglycan-associated lipoprotein
MHTGRRFIFVLLAGLFILATACSKTIIQQPEPVEQEPEPAAQAEPVAPEPIPLPQQEYDPSEKNRALFLHENVYFDYDSADLKWDSQQLLGLKAEWLQDNPDVIAVLIEGHCDERGTEAYNLALGERRARVVKAFLVEQGIAGEKLTTRSRGEKQPVDPRPVEEAWAKNRRVSFFIN